MRVAIAVLCFVASGCSSAPMVTGHIDSFSEAEVSRESPIFFELEGQGLTEKQIIVACRQAAIDAGLKVARNGSDGKYTIRVSGAIAGTEHSTSTSYVPVTSTSYVGNTAVNSYGTQAVTESEVYTVRKLTVSAFQNGSNREELRATVTSNGNSQTLAPVAYEMCLGFFRHYPMNRQGQYFEAPFTQEK